MMERSDVTTAWTGSFTSRQDLATRSKAGLKALGELG
jgi:hypothetical protein